MRRLRSACLLAGAATLAGCGPGLGIRTDGLSDRAFADDGAHVTFDAVADGVGTFRVLVDGSPVLEAVAAGGRAAVVLPTLAPGEHRVVVEAEGVPGVAVERSIFVDRLPDAHVDGLGLTGNTWAVTLSDGQPSDDGLLSGRLTATWVGTDGAHAFSRVLSNAGAIAEISPGPDPRAAWVEGWSQGSGTLRVDAIGGDGTGASEFPGVRGFGFAPDGFALLAVDGGAFLVQTPFVAATRIATDADAASFVDPLEDVVTFALDADGARAHATIAAWPAYEPVAIGVPVAMGAAARPAARELAFRRQPTASNPGGLLVYHVSPAGTEELFGEVSAWGYSPDGSFLAAIVDAGGSGAGTLALATRGAAAAQIATFPGAFVGAGFDPSASFLYGLESNGALARFDLAAFPPARSPLAADVARFGLLANGAVLWETRGGTMWVRLVDGTTFDAGALDPARAEVAFAPDSSAVAFTAVGLAGRHPVRRVDVVSGDVADFGADAHRPAFLAGGALAWAERRADAEAGGLANDDLWLFPSFPASATGGARMLAERVKSDLPFPVSSDGRTLAALTDLPRRGAAWSAHARCFDAAARAVDLGPADPDLRLIQVRPDARILWFAPARTLALSRCH